MSLKTSADYNLIWTICTVNKKFTHMLRLSQEEIVVVGHKPRNSQNLDMQMR